MVANQQLYFIILYNEESLEVCSFKTNGFDGYISLARKKIEHTISWSLLSLSSSNCLSGPIGNRLKISTLALSLVFLYSIS